MSKDSSEEFKALAGLLAHEREALLSGDLAALPQLVLAKEALLERVQAADAPAKEQLAAIRKAADANHALLSAALRGVKAAQMRLDAIRSGGAALSTYDASGKAKTHDGTKSSIERRA